MNELIQYVEQTYLHAKYLVSEYNRLRCQKDFNYILEKPLFDSIGQWYKEYLEIEQKKNAIILEYEAKKIPCESLIKRIKEVRDYIYHELIEWELKKLNTSINSKFLRFTFGARIQLKFFIDSLLALNAKQRESNLNGFDNLNEIISHFTAYLINAEGIVKHDIPNNLNRATKRLEALSKDDLSEEISIKCFWAKREIEKQLLKGGVGVEVLLKKAIDDLDFIYLEFLRLAKEYRLNHADLFHDMLPFNDEFGFAFAPFFCWVKSIQPHKSKVPKTVCENLTDDEPTEIEPKKDFPLIFQELEVYELFLYLVDHYDNDKQVTKYSHLYHFIREVLGGWKTIKKVDYKNYVRTYHGLKMSKVLQINDPYTNIFKPRLINLKDRFIQENKKE